MSLGESRVRVSFNPSGNSTVDDIKRKSAELIDLCDSMGQEAKDDEQKRCLALAMSSYEVAAMWAVKAATA